MSAILKREYVRRPALLKACRLLTCRECGDFPSTAAHSNWSIHGKGRGIKADDNRIAALCLACHRELDQGRALTADERKAMWWRAHVRTVQGLVMLKAWPRKVPVPVLSFPEQWDAACK